MGLSESQRGTFRANQDDLVTIRCQSCTGTWGAGPVVLHIDVSYQNHSQDKILGATPICKTFPGGMLWESPGASTESGEKSLWPGEEVVCPVTQRPRGRARSGSWGDPCSRFLPLQNPSPEIELCLSSSCTVPPLLPLTNSSSCTQIIFLKDGSKDVSLPFKYVC